VTVSDQDFASIRLYRDRTLYQIPLTELYSNRSLQRVRLMDGDSIFVDTEYELEKAQAYFEEQIRLADFRQRSRTAALNALQLEVDIRRNELAEARSNFQTRLELGAVDRDYVYLTGELVRQSRFALPFENRASLADALYSEAGFNSETASPAQIYVLRGSTDPREFSAVTAWQLNARNAANLLLATRFELRPDDVIFIAEQPITRWNRVVSQIVPSLITGGVNAATR